MSIRNDHDLLKDSDIRDVWFGLCALNVQELFDIHPIAPWDVHVGHRGLSLVRRDVPHVRHWLKTLVELPMVVKNSMRMVEPVTDSTHLLLESHGG